MEKLFSAELENASTIQHKSSKRKSTREAQDRGKVHPKWQQNATGQKVPLEEIKCYACGKKGHYKGSKECPKTPTSKRLHAISVDTEGEEEEPQETEEPFKGEDYEGEQDQEFNEASEEEEEEEEEYEGYGTTVATIHVESNSEDKDFKETTATIATMATADAKDEEALVTDIVNSIKEDYELWGSGQKPKP